MFDNTFIIKDAGAVTSTGYGTVDASAQVVDIGEGLVRGNVVIDIDAIKISAGNELYSLHLVGGSDASFTQEVSLCSKEIGAVGALQGNLDSKISRIVLPFQNEERGVHYSYMRIKHVISGTSPSITYRARLEKDLPFDGWTNYFATTTT